MTTRLLPSAVAPPIRTANGRDYASSNAYVDVPDQDAQILAANGWIIVAAVGATSARPVTDPNGARLGAAYGLGRHFVDTTIGKVILWTGASWIDPTTGGAV
jgi:hypothetical protein